MATQTDRCDCGRMKGGFKLWNERMNTPGEDHWAWVMMDRIWILFRRLTVMFVFVSIILFIITSLIYRNGKETYKTLQSRRYRTDL